MERKLSIEYFKAMLKIDKHSLDDELEKQAHIQHQISEYLNKALTRMEVALNDLHVEEARAYKEYSQQKLSGKAPSVEYVKAQVKDDKDRRACWLAYNQAREEHSAWENLYYAWRSRNDALRALASLAASNYFVVETTYERSRR